MPDPIITFGISYTGGDAATRTVGRLEFLPGGGGWPALIHGRVREAVKLGARRIMFPNPWGEMPGAVMAAGAYKDALTAGLYILTDDFVESIQELRSMPGVLEVIVYTGGLLNSLGFLSRLLQWVKPRDHMKFLHDAFWPIWQSGASHAFDGDAIAPNGSWVNTACDLMRAMRPNVPMYVEALWGSKSSWCWDLPVFIKEGSYQYYKSQGFPGNRPLVNTPPVYRIIDSVPNGDWIKEGEGIARRIWADGHVPVIGGDPFVDAGREFGGIGNGGGV